MLSRAPNQFGDDHSDWTAMIVQAFFRQDQFTIYNLQNSILQALIWIWNSKMISVQTLYKKCILQKFLNNVKRMLKRFGQQPSDRLDE